MEAPVQLETFKSSPYGELLDHLATLQQRTARFRRVVLHLHSPDSHDWGRSGTGTSQNQRTRFTGTDGPGEFAAELRKHFDLAAITDHMRCGLASRVSANVRTTTGLVVLPGMEVNFRPEAALGCARIHLLVILREGSTAEAFSRLFAGLRTIPDDGARTGREEVIGIQLAEWVKRVHAEGGICVAAHVENDQGIRARFRQTSREVLQLFTDGDPKEIEREYKIGDNFKEYLFGAGIDAVEITRSADGPHYRWVSKGDGRTRWIPTVLTFDAHCVEDFTKADRVTHMKMTSLGLAGLKEALALPDTRIRFPEAVPSLPSPHLCGVQIVGGANSFFEELAVAFAENLNCLIGARGSGKSTIVEALRYVFGYNRTLAELDKLAEPIRELQAANLADCLIRVVYRTSAGNVRILEATFDPKADYTTKVYTEAGDYVEIADVEASGEYPLRLFGWSEIETLGRSPAKQRDLLDRLVPDLGPALRKKEEIGAKLRTNRAVAAKAIQEVKGAFEKNNSEIRRFKEYKADFGKLNTDEVKGLFSALDLAQNKYRLLSKVKENVETLTGGLGDPSGLTFRAELESVLSQAGQPLRDWWLAEELPRLGLLSAEQDVQKSVREASERLRSFAELLGHHLGEIESRIKEVEQKLRSEFASDTSKQKIADLRANADRRLRHVTALRDDYLKQWEALQTALKQRDEILSRLVATQHEISGIRARHNNAIEERLNQFLPGTMRVAIQFIAGGDTEAFAAGVAPFFSAASRYKARKLPELAARHFSASEVAVALRRGELRALFADRAVASGVTLEFTDEDIGKITAATNPFDHDEHADVATLADEGKRLERLLQLEEVLWDDAEAVLLNGRPVNEMSPGQRSSAMLPLIALTQNTPLVIDQPEDNLDKRLIGSVLANVLAHLKEHRQIIVCTHDPNILVGGDAEQVVVLEALSDRKGNVALHGSIDNSDIVQTVVDVLEGGKEAFEARHRCYEGRVSS